MRSLKACTCEPYAFSVGRPAGRAFDEAAKRRFAAKKERVTTGAPRDERARYAR